MTDDPRLPDPELASAYLDGDLTAAERARVEASPELTDMAAAFAAVRVELADVPPAAPAVRDAALAAALAEFDLHHEAAPVAPSAPVAPPAPVLPFFRRRWVRPALAAAAAVAIVGVVGVTALPSGDDRDEASQVTASADREMSATVADDGTGAGAPMSTIGEISGPADAAIQVFDEAQLLALAQEYANTPDAGGGEAGTETTAAAEAAPTAATSRDAFGCPLAPNQVVVADIIWIDTLAVAVLDTVSGEVVALDAQCNVLVSVVP